MHACNLFNVTSTQLDHFVTGGAWEKKPDEEVDNNERQAARVP